MRKYFLFVIIVFIMLSLPVYASDCDKLTKQDIADIGAAIKVAKRKALGMDLLLGDIALVEVYEQRYTHFDVKTLEDKWFGMDKCKIEYVYWFWAADVQTKTGKRLHAGWCPDIVAHIIETDGKRVKYIKTIRDEYSYKHCRSQEDWNKKYGKIYIKPRTKPRVKFVK